MYLLCILNSNCSSGGNCSRELLFKMLAFKKNLAYCISNKTKEITNIYHMNYHTRISGHRFKMLLLEKGGFVDEIQIYLLFFFECEKTKEKKQTEKFSPPPSFITEYLLLSM